MLGATHLAFGHTVQGVLIGLGVLSLIALVISLRVWLDEIRAAASVTHDALNEAAVTGPPASEEAVSTWRPPKPRSP